MSTINVDANSHRFEDFGDWVAVAGEQFREGSIQLFHHGKDLVLGSQIYLTDETHSLSFEEKLTELGKPGSARLHGVWWLPSPKGGVKLVLSNSTNTMLSVSTTIRGESPKREVGTTVDVRPHETKVLDLERDLLGREQSAMSSFGAISIEHNGEPGALLARAMAHEASRGYSLPIQFTDPATAKSNNVQNPGFNSFNQPVTASGNTDGDGTFVDNPIGVCAEPPGFPAGTRATFNQRLFALIGSTAFNVKINNFSVSLRSDCGDATNGVDIDVENCP